MKKLSLLRDLLLVLTILTAGSSLCTAQFSKHSIAEAKARAAQLQKPLLVHFYANWCLPCQWMDQHTFADPGVSTHLQRYLAIKVDVDELRGYTDKEVYGVKFLPTILIFNASGVVVARFEETLDAQLMTDMLLKYDTPANRSVHNSGKLIQPPQVAGSTTIAVPVARLNAAEHSSLLASAEDDPAQLDALRRAPGLNPVSEKPQYAPRKMGVQLGVYSHYENVIRQVQFFEKKFYKSVNIATKTSNGQSYYHLIAGPFETPAQLQGYLNSLQREGLKGLIVEL
jgi:thiol-disulfide isomerase/thioredoxin